VFSFEPHPRVFTYLKENVEFNQLENVELFQCALGPRQGRTWLTDLTADDQNFVAARGVDIPLRVLDECVPADVRISLLKLDVEGYEKFVLEGAADTLARTECIYFEALEPLCARYGYTVSELLQTVIDAGFAVRPEPPDSRTPANFVASR
jgi:FkbM family methyltransferase